MLSSTSKSPLRLRYTLACFEPKSRCKLLIIRDKVCQSLQESSSRSNKVNHRDRHSHAVKLAMSDDKLSKIPLASHEEELQRLLIQATRKRKADNNSPKQDFKRRILESRLTSVRKLPTPGMLKASRIPPKLIYFSLPDEFQPPQ